MIWHEEISKDPHWNPLTSQPNQLDKRPVITVLLENNVLRVASIDDVVAKVADRRSGRAWHTATYRVPAGYAREE